MCSRSHILCKHKRLFWMQPSCDVFGCSSALVWSLQRWMMISVSWSTRRRMSRPRAPCPCAPETSRWRLTSLWSPPTRTSRRDSETRRRRTACCAGESSSWRTRSVSLSSFMMKEKPALKCLYNGLWKVHILVLGVSNNRLTCMQGHFLIKCIYFYLICSTTPKRFTQRFIFPNPSFVWRYSALIGRFHLKQSTVLLCVQRYRGNSSKSGT